MNTKDFLLVVELCKEALLDEGIAEQANQLCREVIGAFEFDASDHVTVAVCTLAMHLAIVGDMVDIAEARRMLP